jgi:type II secretory pathway pseudopilin PulG
VELLTVIGIIALLLAIFVPTVTSAIKTMRANETSSRIEKLSRGIELFAEDNAGYLPGQLKPERIKALHDQTTTGSRLLAETLFTSAGGGFPASGYLEYKSEMLTDYYSADDTLFQDLLADGHPGGSAMPICYYPARRVHRGKLGSGDQRQYVYEDNAPLTQGREHTTGFNKYVTYIPESMSDSTPVSNRPVQNDGRYLLIAPGPDRIYFSSDDRKNW